MPQPFFKVTTRCTNSAGELQSIWIGLPMETTRFLGLCMCNLHSRSSCTQLVFRHTALLILSDTQSVGQAGTLFLDLIQQPGPPVIAIHVRRISLSPAQKALGMQGIVLKLRMAHNTQTPPDHHVMSLGQRRACDMPPTAGSAVKGTYRLHPRLNGYVIRVEPDEVHGFTLGIKKHLIVLVCRAENTVLGRFHTIRKC